MNAAIPFQNYPYVFLDAMIILWSVPKFIFGKKKFI